MSIVKIEGWSGIAPDKAAKWIEGTTQVMLKHFHEPLDEIVVFITTTDPCNWGQAGVVGTDPDWIEKSKRRE